VADSRESCPECGGTWKVRLATEAEAAALTAAELRELIEQADMVLAVMVDEGSLHLLPRPGSSRGCGD
jgi:hypothetical protein